MARITILASFTTKKRQKNNRITTQPWTFSFFVVLFCFVILAIICVARLCTGKNGIGIVFRVL